MRIKPLLAALAITSIVGVATQGCAAPEVEEARGDSNSSEVGTGGAKPGTKKSAAGGADDTEDMCSDAASKQRAKATFDRTAGCAVDVVTLGLGKKLKTSAEVLNEMTIIIEEIAFYSGRVQITNSNSAKAMVCAASVAEYTTGASLKTAFTAAAVDLPQAQVDELFKAATSGLTGGVSEMITAFQDWYKAKTDPEKAIKFLTAAIGGLGNFATFVRDCSTVLEAFGLKKALPNLTKYIAPLADIGNIGTLINCSTAVLFNGADVYAEWSCLAKDWERIEEQTKSIRNATDKLCSQFANYAKNPAMQPILESKRDKAMCAEIVRHWGFCVADSKKDGVLWGKNPLTCDECRTVCGGYVNGAGKNAYLESILEDGYGRTGGADRIDVQEMVRAAGSCVVGTADSMQPCINNCLNNGAIKCPAQ